MVMTERSLDNLIICEYIFLLKKYQKIYCKTIQRKFLPDANFAMLYSLSMVITKGGLNGHSVISS